jgi:phenylalanyl-tRNA synthetase alpha chain
MIAPGRVFRRDTPDPTHNPMFFQVEGLCVDRGISMAHLKGTGLQLATDAGAQTVTRFRPSYFPFTEPSAEFDFAASNVAVLVAASAKLGMDRTRGRHGSPQCSAGAGVDPAEFSGFAFGLGIDRMVALDVWARRYPAAFENDLRFLNSLIKRMVWVRLWSLTQFWLVPVLLNLRSEI